MKAYIEVVTLNVNDVITTSTTACTGETPTGGDF